MLNSLERGDIGDSRVQNCDSKLLKGFIQGSIQGSIIGLMKARDLDYSSF